MPLRYALPLVLAAALASAPATVHAAKMACGTVVEDRITLDRDLRCSGAALIIRNPRSVVQMNGHVIESSRACDDSGGATGIVIEPTAGRAQILGPGIVRGFHTGIAVNGTAQVQLRDLRVSDSCAIGVVVRGTNATRGRNLFIDRNGDGSTGTGGVRVEQSQRFALADSEVFLNDAGASGAAIDLHGCAGCRVAGNRVLANRGAGLRLDGDSQGNEVERNLILGQRPYDVVDQGADNIFVLNGFERGDGVDPPSAWPLLGMPASPAPGIAGCGTMNARVDARATITLACPQETGLRAVRNSVVSYRLLSIFDSSKPSGDICDPVSLRPAGASGGGAVTCTSSASLWPSILEVTCCLN